MPGEEFTLDIEMHFTSWVFPKGHRIRFAVNNAQWPMLWPTPYPMTTTLQLGGGTRLSLPVVPFEKRPVPAFLPPSEGPAAAGLRDARRRHELRLRRDLLGRPQSADRRGCRDRDQHRRPPLSLGRGALPRDHPHEVTDGEPGKASLLGTHRMEVELPGRKLLWEAELSFKSDHDNFYYSYLRRLSENGKLVREKTWTRTIPRDFQ